MTFADTVIRLEHLPKDAQTGAALELRVARYDSADGGRGFLNYI